MLCWTGAEKVDQGGARLAQGTGEVPRFPLSSGKLTADLYGEGAGPQSMRHGHGNQPGDHVRRSLPCHRSSCLCWRQLPAHELVRDFSPLLGGCGVAGRCWLLGGAVPKSVVKGGVEGSPCSHVPLLGLLPPIRPLGQSLGPK